MPFENCIEIKKKRITPSFVLPSDSLAVFKNIC